MSGIITKDPATFITRGELDSKHILLSLFGIAVILALMARKVRGAILIGILITTGANLIFGFVSYEGIAALPPDPTPTLFKLQFPNIFAKLDLIPVIFVFFAIDMFDSIGTLTPLSAIEPSSWKPENLPKPDAHLWWTQPVPLVVLVSALLL